ncbi:MAG: DNA repair protein RadA [Firmicutes bacterium]|nr:DNA repair protein RadA [Bacillota bacterium]
MSAGKKLFICQECGYETFKWLGRCPSCNSWNSFLESSPPSSRRDSPPARVSLLKDLPLRVDHRLRTGLLEFDRVLGGGAVPGSVILLGGDPGIGKSTLLLQVASRLSVGHEVLYVSGEESLHQLKLRAERINAGTELPVVMETALENILEVASRLRPGVLVIDSVQSCYRSELGGVPGSPVQVREVTAELVKLAKKIETVVFLIGHVTKEGVMAGPRLLEHMVDSVLYLEGDRGHSFRILRGVKNRFGSTNEIGVFVMEERGLAEVVNPSAFFVTRRSRSVQGAAVTASMEGTRPLLVEVQALVIPSCYATPRRASVGIDLNRAALIMAVLARHAGDSFVGLDTFINVVGGVRITEPAADLAVAAALVSSLKEKTIGSDTVVIGEIGLTGEILPVSDINIRLREGVKLGYQNYILPRASLTNLKDGPGTVNITGVDNIKEAIDACLLG